MAYMEIPLCLKGFSEILPVENQEPATSPFMSNCRPRDVLEKRIRIGKRPGLKKAYSQQIGDESYPIVALCSITVVA